MTSTRELVSAYDAALFDLDGVIYLGPNAIDGVPETIDGLRDRGVKIGYVTNNAARTPETVAAHLTQLGIAADVADVVTSVQAMMRVLQRDMQPGSKVLALGTDALVSALENAGFEPVFSHEERPVAVVQGYHPGTSWAMLEEGAIAIQHGAAWYVTNPDLTRPTDRGIVPGCGAQMAVVQACVSATPTMAGKPYRPLLDETVLRLESKCPIFVGDRIDTDILGANNVGMDSLFVFTGAHGKYDLLAAAPGERPTYIASDISGLLRPARIATGDSKVTCGKMCAAVHDGIGELLTTPVSRHDHLDALWALLQVAWHQDADVHAAVEQLTELR